MLHLLVEFRVANFVSVLKTREKGESSYIHSFVVGNEAFSPTTTFDHACSAFALSFAFVPVFFSLSFSLSLSSRGARDSFFFNSNARTANATDWLASCCI